MSYNYLNKLIFNKNHHWDIIIVLHYQRCKPVNSVTLTWHDRSRTDSIHTILVCIVVAWCDRKACVQGVEDHSIPTSFTTGLEVFSISGNVQICLH